MSHEAVSDISDVRQQIAFWVQATEELIPRLRKAKNAAAAGGDTLLVATECLLAILDFFERDLRVIEEGLLAPVGALLAAVIGTAQGSKPPLFFDRPKNPKGGRPPDPRLDGMRAVIAYCIELLVDTKLMKRPEASDFVAKEAQKLGMKGASGRLIGSRAAARFRDEIGGRAPAGAATAFCMMLARRALQPLPSSKAAAQEEVRQTLRRFVSRTGF